MLIMGVGLVLMGIAVGIQTHRVESIKAEYAAFVANVKMLGEQAEIKSKQIEVENKLRKEKADAENKRARAVIADLNKHLRDSAGSGFLPAAAPGALRPLLACYSRGGLDEAIRGFATETTSVLEVLGAAAVDLNTAKAWATPPSQ